MATATSHWITEGRVTAPSLEMAQPCPVSDIHVMTIILNITKVIFLGSEATDIIFNRKIDVAILVDVREPDPTTIAHLKRQLKRRYSLFSVLHTHINRGKGPGKVGGVLSITTERIFHPEVVSQCQEGSSLTIKATFGGCPVVFHGLYLPSANRDEGSFSSRVSAMSGESPEIVVAADISAAADFAMDQGALLVVGGDFNSSPRQRAQAHRICLNDICLDNGLVHASTAKELLLPTYVKRQSATHIDYQIRNGTHVLATSCFPFEVAQFPYDHQPLMGIYRLPRSGPSVRHQD